MEQQKQQTNNYVINRIDTALEAEEFKHMQNMLEPLPLNMVSTILLSSLTTVVILPL